jgi:hypothetical protein
MVEYASPSCMRRPHIHATHRSGMGHASRSRAMNSGCLAGFPPAGCRALAGILRGLCGRLTGTFRLKRAVRLQGRPFVKKNFSGVGVAHPLSAERALVNRAARRLGLRRRSLARYCVARRRHSVPGPAVMACRRRFADPPAGALLTCLATAVGPASRRLRRRRYADAPTAAFRKK